MPKRGLGSTPVISRTALAILLLAACFIAALALAFGPYQFPSLEPSVNLESTVSGEALSSPSSSLEDEKKQFESYSPYEEENPGFNLPQNNSSNANIQTIAASSTSNNSTKLHSPVIPEDKSEVAIFSMGGGGGGGSSSSSSSQTAVTKPASTKSLQPEKTASTSPTAAGAASSNVQGNTSVAGKNLSNISLTGQDNLTLKGNQTESRNSTEKDNLTLDRVVSPEIGSEANPAPVPSSIIAENETNVAGVATGQDPAEPVSAPSSGIDISNSDNNSNNNIDNRAGNVSAKAVSSSAVSSQSSSSQEGPSIESDLSRAIRQSEIKLAQSNDEGSDSNLPPVLKALVADRASPQLQGSAIFWKAEATDEEGDKILYRFFLDGREVRKWSKINSWSWLSQGLPARDYQITVLAIDGNHAAEDCFDSILNTSFTLSRPNLAPVLQQLKPDKTSPQGKGSIITWTASANDPDNDQINFKFMKNDAAVSDWSSSGTWVWDTSSEKPGDYKIAVLAKDGLHASKDAFDSTMDEKFTLISPNGIPEVTGLIADKPSPQAAGSAITWTAIAVDPDGDRVSYKFLANDKEVRPWSSSNSWVWDTSSATPGEYRIKVLARDGSHSSDESFDSFKDAVMTITVPDSNQPPVLSSLVSDIASPDVQGVTVIWKAEAYDPDGDKILYKFQQSGRDMGRWSESASWKWSTRDLAPGDYKIRVLARDGKHAPESSFDSSRDAVFSLISEIDQQINQLMKKRSKDASQQEKYQSTDIQVTSGNATNTKAVLGKGNGTAG